MKKIISVFIVAAFLVSLAACGSANEPTIAVISPEDYDALNEKHMSSLLVGMIIAQAWQDANEVEPERFMYYYAAALLQSGKSDFGTWEDGFIPADELEPMIHSHFDVTTEHLRTNEYYDAERNAYEFGGLGSTTTCKLTSAVRNGKQVTIDYDLYGPMDYKVAFGKLLIEFDNEDYKNSENYKYLSNQFEWSAQYRLAFPSAMDETDKYNVFMMNSGEWSARGSDEGEDRKEYDGRNISSIIAFYENEALPALEAQGSADTGKYEDGWYWSGTYRDGKPLTIDILRRFGADTYIITALYDEKSDPDVANNIRSREFMQPPDLNYFPRLYSKYLWEPFSANVLNTSWDVVENLDIPSLVAFYAFNLSDEDRNATTEFAAENVESYVQRYFDISTDTMRGSNIYDRDKNVYTYAPTDNPAVCSIVSATSYGSEDESLIKIVLAYNVTRSEDDDTVIWSGELTVELSGSGYKYISNNKCYPQYPITQDAVYLEEITKKYVRPLIPYGSILINSWPTAGDISADNLIDFCAFNNLLNLPLDENKEYTIDNQHGQAEQVEATITRYFDVTVEYLRTSSRYNYTDGYIMLNGGGGGRTYALNAEQDGDLLKITVGLYGPDDEAPDRPAKIGLLTIRLEGDNYQYLSYELE